MRALLTIFLIIAITPIAVFAQGSIFGTVNLSSGEAPSEGELRFFGYIDGTDNEVRLLNCDGAGYDGNNWWDDFQNYLDEAPGLPYRYLYFSPAVSEFAELANTIPSNSFQQEDISMTAGSYPLRPSLSATAESGSVRLNWSGCADCSYHVYRRPNGVAGSFFRIDDPTGNLSVPGLAETTYLDTDVSTVDQYEYLVMARQSDGTFSPPSDLATVSAGLCGDLDLSGQVVITDAVYMINFIFAEGPAPLDPYDGDVDCSGSLNITDAVYIVNYIFAFGPPPCDGC